MGDDDFFAPPPFKAADALERARRDLRALGLAEREGRFERRGQTVARIAVDGDALRAAVVRHPGRSPEWAPDKTVRDHAALRDWIADLKRKLASWTDRDE